MYFINYITNFCFSCHENRELEQLQNEKRKALLEHETAKLRECDDALQRELRDWKGQLLPRKQVILKLYKALNTILIYLL